MSHDILEHYGTKGMKWGVRKVRGSAKGKGKSARKTAKTLTNKELKKRVDRLNMEKQYTELSNKKNATTTSRGKAFVTKILVTAGKQKMQQLATKAVSDVVDIGMTRARSRG